MVAAIVIDRTDDGQTVEVRDVGDADLPEAAVTVDVQHSTLNFKDALAITGSSPVVRSFPMVPGIDLAGTVSASSDDRWAVGAPVVLNGWGVGERHWGGLAQRARVEGDWLLALPEGLTTWQAMAIGTAGYTAALCVDALEDDGVAPGAGEVLVTGATGGVGSIAIALLAAAGHEVVAATGKGAESEYLQRVGAASVLDRAELAEPGKPLQKERWAGVVDAVGSHVLVNACAQTRYGGTVAACGLAQGMDFPASVAPFILRGVTLRGIDSVMAPVERRQRAWARLARDLDAALLDEVATEISLGEAIGWADRFLAGSVRGRVVVDVNR